jgi:Mrp family chromosome partitioning ATPase
MGKILDTLRQAGPSALASQLPPSDTPRTEAPLILAETAPEEEVPYFEVGPRRTFEASPAVLATIPAPGAVLPLKPPQVQHSAALPKPHNVLFRAVAAASRFARELVAFHEPGQPAAAAYAELLQNIGETVKRRSPHRASVLLFTASRPRVGATTALLNVAITAARGGAGVVVVDANLRRAAIADRLGLDPAPGLTDVLAGEHSLAEALRPTEQGNLFALTAGAPTPTLASSEELRVLLDQLREKHELVLLDAPHWDGRAGVAALAAACDAVLLVVPASEADSSQANDLVRALPEHGIRLAGCVLTPS